MTEEERAQRVAEQKAISEFKGILHRIMECTSTPADYLYLRRHNDQMKKEGGFGRGAVRLCARNADKDECNLDALEELGERTRTPIVRIEAIHTGPLAAAETKAEDAGNLQRALYLAKGCEVVCTWNGWKEAGLINGARGTVHEIIYGTQQGPPGLPLAILVQMDAPGYRGPSFLEGTPRIVKFTPIKHDFELGKERCKCSRTQFPLAPGYANSIHKAQGQTLDKVVGNLGTREFNAGLTYVLFSRVRRLRDIILDPFPGPARFFNDKDAIRSRQAHERVLEGMYHRVIVAELARSKEMLLGASAAENDRRLDAIRRIVAGSEAVFIPWGWKTFELPRRRRKNAASAPAEEYVAGGGIISVRDALKTAALSYKASRQAQELRRAQKTMLPNKLLRQYQVDRLRKVASNESEDSEKRGAAASTLEEHEEYVKSVHQQHREEALALKKMMAEVKAREADESLNAKRQVDHMGSALAKAKAVDRGQQARVPDSGVSSRSSTSLRARPSTRPRPRAPAQPHGRPEVQTPRDLFRVAPNSHGFHFNMQHVLVSSGLPLFPGYVVPQHAVPLPTPTTDARALKLRMRLVDYLDANEYSTLWASLESWAQDIGFDVFRDHSASQIGVSCGIVAARVVTWLKASQNFMEEDTTGAVSSEVLRTANTDVLCLMSITDDGGVPLSEYDDFCTPGRNGEVAATAAQTYYLTSDDTAQVAEYFHGARARILTFDSHDGFVRILPIDETIKFVAQAVFKATTGDASAYGDLYFITNDKPTGDAGYHWATLVISIEPPDETVAFETRAHTTAAPNQTNHERTHVTNTRLSFGTESNL